MSRQTRDRGFALPVAVFALVVVGVLVTSGFFLARQETRISIAGDHAGEALYLAERGMDEVRIDWKQRKYNALNLWQDTTITGTTSRGEWTVHVIRTDTTNFFARSVGTVTQGGDVLGGATREVGLFLRIKFPELEPPAALASMGSMEREGRGTINGNDTDPDNWGGSCSGTENKPGALGEDVDSIHDGGGQGTISGDPAQAEDTNMTSDSLLTYGELTYDDLTGWAEKVYTGNTLIGAGDVAPATTTVDGETVCDTEVKGNWGEPTDPTHSCFDYFPTIHVQGDLEFGSSSYGQGILLVDGDITLKGGFEFHGIIIAKGDFLSEGQGGHIYGGLIAANSDGDAEGGRVAGNSTIQYSSCAAERAVRNSQGVSRPETLTYRSWADLTSISY